MILQALKEYADRKGDTLGTIGFEIREIPFVIVLNPMGEFVEFQDMREKEGKKFKAKTQEVPQSFGRSGKDAWKKAFILWDHYGYVLGFTPSNKKKNVVMAENQHKSFVEQVEEIYHRCPNDISVKAVVQFLKNKDFTKIFAHTAWSECAKIKGCNLTFRLAGETKLVCQSDNVRNYVAEKAIKSSDDNIKKGVCLVTGIKCDLMRLHPTIALPGLTKPSPLCAINNGESPAFSSFKKDQGYNFPVSRSASMAYAKATNSLIKSIYQRLTLNNVVIVFWSSKDSFLEREFADFFNKPPILDISSLYEQMEVWKV